MAKHNITVNIPEQDIGNADVEFKVKRDNKVLGTLKVSKGNLEWVPRDYTFGYIMQWPDVDALMRKNGVKKQ